MMGRKRRNSLSLDSTLRSNSLNKICTFSFAKFARFVIIHSLKDYAKAKQIELLMPVDIEKIMRDQKVDAILDNDEVCERLYPLVPKRMRSKQALKRIVDII